MHIRFTGAFKDLIPKGFRFRKMYARHYRCYTTYNPDEINNPRPTLWIYQKNRSVEIQDWGEFEVPILEYLKGKTFEKDIVSLICDQKTLNVTLMDRNNSILAIIAKEAREEITEEESAKLCKEYYKRYREIVVDIPALYRELKRIEGMYEIIKE